MDMVFVATSQSDPAAIAGALEQRLNSRACEHLMGMIDGMVADGHLHDREVQALSVWLSEHRAACDRWPVSVVARLVRDVLADGVITEEERAHLHENLVALSGSQFALTGSTQAEVATLPIEDAVTVALAGAGICLTGAFLYGTRAACERASLKVGAMPLDAVTRSVGYLVVGSRVSRDWAHTSFGRKIQRAVELQEAGHEIEIISEQRWLQALGDAGGQAESGRRQ